MRLNKTRFCGLVNGPLIMTFSAFLGVCDIYKLAKYGDLRVKKISRMCNVGPRWFPWYWELWAQCTQVLHNGWTLFQVISTYRKQYFYIYIDESQPWPNG